MIYFIQEKKNGRQALGLTVNRSMISNENMAIFSSWCKIYQRMSTLKSNFLFWIFEVSSCQLFTFVLSLLTSSYADNSYKNDEHSCSENKSHAVVPSAVKTSHRIRHALLSVHTSCVMCERSFDAIDFTTISCLP